MLLFLLACTGEDTPDTATELTCDPGDICTMAGTGIAGLGTESVDALESHLYLPQDLSFGPDGQVYLLDWNNHRVRTIDADGVITTIAGTGMLGDGPVGPALNATFNHPTNIAFDGSGHLLLAAWHNSRVEQIDLVSGELTFLCGTGARGYNGQAIDATTAVLDLPSSIDVDSIGRVWISDQANQMIRVVEDGLIYDMAGRQRVSGYLGDGGPAADALFYASVGQAADPSSRIAIEGNTMYIADTGNHLVRKMDIDTLVIERLAGTPPTCDETGIVCSWDNAGTTGDGGAALAAKLTGPTDLAVGPNGDVYIADTGNSCVRVVHTDGTIDTLAGQCGVEGFEGDGGPATDALLHRPYGLTVAPDGAVWIADTYNQRLRRVVP